MDKKNSTHLVDSFVSRLRKGLLAFRWIKFYTRSSWQRGGVHVRLRCGSMHTNWWNHSNALHNSLRLWCITMTDLWKYSECIYPAMPFALLILIIVEWVMFVECIPAVQPFLWRGRLYISQGSQLKSYWMICLTWSYESLRFKFQLITKATDCSFCFGGSQGDADVTLENLA